MAVSTAHRNYDYIVAGGGSAGCIVATRLAQAGADVLVLEAGPNDHRRLDVTIPAMVTRIYNTLNWKYPMAPDQSRNGKLDIWAAGKVLGGGGSINGCVYIRGNPGDYDEWARLGCTGWDYASVLPAFKKLETWVGGADDCRGGEGPIHVEFHGLRNHPANQAFVKAAMAAGYPYVPDYNSAQPEGVSETQVNQRRGRRSQSSKEYLHRLAPKNHVTITTGAFINRILFEGNRAVGVEYVQNGEVKQTRAGSEVVLSSGSLGSPKILMLSGIGPRDELERHGLPVLHKSEGVGRNLHDHCAVPLRYHTKLKTINSMGTFDKMSAVWDYLVHGRGVLSTTPLHCHVLLRTNPSLDRPNIQLVFIPFQTGQPVTPEGKLVVEIPKEPGITTAPILTQPRTRGRLRLRSASPTDMPIIEYQFLSDPADMADLLIGLEKAQEIMAQAPIADHVQGLFEPEASCRTEADWQNFVRQVAGPSIHPVSSCRMGVDEGAVVDPELRVIGVKGLRVIDASISPKVPTGNNNAASMMIGERGAEFLLKASR